MASVKMHLTILPKKLRIGSIPNTHAQLFTHPLLELLLYSEKEDKFVCVTKTEYEISLVTESDDIEKVNEYAKKYDLQNAVQLWPQNWVALRPDLGSAASSEGQSIVSSLAHPLAQANITIFYLSTYSSDYCLVEEKNIEKALRVLRSQFKLLVEGEDCIQSLQSEQESEPPPEVGPQSKEDIDRHTLYFHEWDVHLAQVLNVQQIAKHLIELLFFSESAKLISYIEIEREISLILDTKLFNMLPQKSVNNLSLYSESWKIFSVGDEPLGYYESGIVNSISTPLTQCTLSIFYISTFRTDYCLVLEGDYEASLRTLREHFTVEHKREAH